MVRAPKEVRTSAAAALALVLLVLCSGCRHRVSNASAAPVAPSLTPPPAPPAAGETPEQPASSSLADTPSDAEFVRTHAPIYTEVGMASWYGPPYNRRRGANGQIYDENALTAAHRTLPLNSLVRVTNLKTGQSAIVRITDRGPFVPGRILDLSLATAKAVGVWRPGVAKVRLDVYGSPGEAAAIGRWCVQIGPFRGERTAVALRNSLSHKYPSAKVIEFTGPTGHWVRILPARNDRSQAAAIAALVKPREGEAYLVRLD